MMGSESHGRRTTRIRVNSTRQGVRDFEAGDGLGSAGPCRAVLHC